MVDRLHAGDYAVAISDFDGQRVRVPERHHHDHHRRPAHDGDGGLPGRPAPHGRHQRPGERRRHVDGIMVTLSGDADETRMTADGGQYAFTGLAEGDYAVAIAGWDEAAYSFDMAEADVPVGDGAAVVQNFDGMHTRTAKVKGMLFLDEVNSDMMYTDGEPALAHAGVPLLLQGPGVNDVQFRMSDSSRQLLVRRPDGGFVPGAGQRDRLAHGDANRGRLPLLRRAHRCGGQRSGRGRKRRSTSPSGSSCRRSSPVR